MSKIEMYYLYLIYSIYVIFTTYLPILVDVELIHRILNELPNMIKIKFLKLKIITQERVTNLANYL